MLTKTPSSSSSSSSTAPALLPAPLAASDAPFYYLAWTANGEPIISSCARANDWTLSDKTRQTDIPCDQTGLLCCGKMLSVGLTHRSGYFVLWACPDCGKERFQ